MSWQKGNQSMSDCFNLDKVLNKCKNFKKEELCVKFIFNYNGLSIRAYFSFLYGRKCFSLVIFSEKKYYFKPMNINNLQINPQDKYLNNIPPELLSHLLDEESSLKRFYRKLFDVVNRADCRNCNYNKDYDYVKAVFYMENHHNNEVKPFFSHLAKKNMSDEQFYRLIFSLDFDIKLVKKIKKLGYTICTTYYIDRAKDFYSEAKSLIISSN